MRLLILILISLLLSLDILAKSYIVTPLNKQGHRQLALLLKRGEVQSWENIYSRDEQQYLRQRGVPSADAIKVELQASAVFLKWKKEFLTDVRFELNGRIELTDYDPLLKEQWGLHNSGVIQEIDITDIDVAPIQGIAGADVGFLQLPRETNREIIVAILDTGVDYQHPDLKGAIYHNRLECQKLQEYDACLAEHSLAYCKKIYAQVDADGNGYPLDCAGWNVLGHGDSSYVKGSNDASDTVGHGTHIAGIIAARHNGIGIEGIGQQIKILPVKIMGEQQGGLSSLPSANESDLPPIRSYADIFARGLLYAIRSGADVINMSLGWSRGVDSVLMHDLVKLAIREGIIVVAAAGNDATSSPIYPCSYDGVICVGAFSADGKLSHFSNYGANVDIVAPGQKILSTWPMKLIPRYYTERRGYEFKNGTSMAAPFVSGAVARLLNSGFSPNEAVARLLSGAVKYEQKYYWQTGNLQLSNSFKVSPRPLIYPQKKSPYYLVWDGQSSDVSTEITLKNLWQHAEQVTLELSFLSAQQDFSLKRKRFIFNHVKSGMEISLPIRLHLENLNPRSELVVQIDVTADSCRDTYFVQLEMLTALTNDRHLAYEQLIDLPTAFHRSAEDEIRSFTNLLEEPNQYDYLVLRPARRGVEVRLLHLEADKQEITSLHTLAGVQASQLLGLWKLDVDGDGERDYVLAFKRFIRGARRGHHKERSLKRKIGVDFYFFDKSFTPKKMELLGQKSAIIKYISDSVVIDKEFQWVRNRGELVPAWVGSFTAPRRVNPWITAPVQSEQVLYYFGKDGLEHLQFDQDLRVLGFLKKRVPTLYFAKGSGFVYQFFSQVVWDIAKLKDGISYASLEFGSHYFMLGGAQEYQVMNSTSSAFVDIVSDGGLYLGVEGEGTLHLESGLVTDPLHSISAISWFNQQFNTFAIGKYNLYFFSNEKLVASTSLKRFSFIPGMTFDKFLFPVTDQQGRLAIYFPGALGVSLTTEIITLRDGELVRPARYRILATDGCEELNHVQSEQGSALIYLCQDNLRIIPLDFN